MIKYQIEETSSLISGLVLANVFVRKDDYYHGNIQSLTLFIIKNVKFPVPRQGQYTPVPASRERGRERRAETSR